MLEAFVNMLIHCLNMMLLRHVTADNHYVTTSIEFRASGGMKTI